MIGVGGNLYYVDDISRAKRLAERGIEYVDVGTSGSVWGLERGYCMMIGGSKATVEHLDPIFSTIAPGIGDIDHTPVASKAAAPPNKAICTVAPTAQDTSSRWSITASSTA
jgi:6-phosphogluconate dehydrogenase (decarboxylating)